MSNPAQLSPDEIVPGRPFSVPQNSFEDLKVMRSMARQLVESYDDPRVCDFTPGGRPVCQSDEQGRHFRIYYIQPVLLFEPFTITAVGFFGQKRPEADIQPIIEADRKLETQFHVHPGLLSLSTVRLPDGDFGNLVLFTSSEAKERWNQNPLHHKLAAEVSPPYYRSIRLNNGILPEGLSATDELYLERTRYIDYDDDPPWRAVREF